MEKMTCSVQETQEIAEDFTSQVLQSKRKREHACVIALSGDLGSGKTCFVQGVARALGIVEQVISPTFVLERIYKLKKSPFEHFIHIDCYRLEGSNEMKALGWAEMLRNHKNLIIIEWAERIKDILPEDALAIHLEATGENERKFTFSKNFSW